MTDAVVDEETGLPIGPEVDAGPATAPERADIAGRHIRLTPLDAERHAASLWEGVGGAEKAALWLYMPDGPYTDFETFRAALARKAASTDPLFFAFVDEAGACLGHAAFMRIDLPNRVIEIGNIVFAPALQRSAAATEALYLMMRHAFEALGNRRLEWKCNALNAPSRAAAARLGFTYEGVFRQAVIVKGRNRNTAWYSVTDEEWPVRRRAFDEWFAPANFDASGRQKTSLSTLNRIAAEVEDLTLHRATPADVPAIARLKTDAYLPNETIIGVPSIPRTADYAELMRTHEIWLLRDRSGPSAALVLDRNAGFTVWSVAVSPAAQGGGVGGKLMRFAEERARALGHDEVRLFTHEKLTERIAWYGRLGYETERIEDRGDRRAVHMKKTLGGTDGGSAER